MDCGSNHVKSSHNIVLVIRWENIQSNYIKTFVPETLKYWAGVQRGQSYLMGRRCLFNLGWQPF